MRSNVFSVLIIVFLATCNRCLPSIKLSVFKVPKNISLNTVILTYLEQSCPLSGHGSPFAKYQLVFLYFLQSTNGLYVNGQQCQLLVHISSNNVTHKVEQVNFLVYYNTNLRSNVFSALTAFVYIIEFETLVFIGYWCTVYPFAILIFNIYWCVNQNISWICWAWLTNVPMPHNLWVHLWLCSAGKSTKTYIIMVQFIAQLTAPNSCFHKSH